jgi:hypothetical protein
MPFIAIALAISVFLGGSAAAMTTPLGHHVVERAHTTWAHLEANFANELGITSDSNDEKAETEAHAQGGLRIRSDADTEAQAVDEAQNAEAAAHAEAEGGVKVNIF